MQYCSLAVLMGGVQTVPNSFRRLGVQFALLLIFIAPAVKNWGELFNHAIAALLR